MRLLAHGLLALALSFGLLPSNQVTAAPAAPARSPGNKGAPAKAAKPMPADNKEALAKVVAHIKSVGRQQAFLDFTGRKPPFFDNDRNRYVVCVDANRVVVAHGGFPTYVGSSEFFQDASGKVMSPLIWAAVTKGDGTLRYEIRSDETNNKVEKKVALFQRIKDDVCGIVARSSD
jgi:hypothetical protein